MCVLGHVHKCTKYVIIGISVGTYYFDIRKSNRYTLKYIPTGNSSSKEKCKQFKVPSSSKKCFVNKYLLMYKVFLK